MKTLLTIPFLMSLLTLSTMNTNAGSEKNLFDFQAATNSALWQIVNDNVMGGVSVSSFRQTNGAAIFQGKVSMENNGGFASVRSLPARHDIASCNAFVLRVRGDGRREVGHYDFHDRVGRGQGIAHHVHLRAENPGRAILKAPGRDRN